MATKVKSESDIIFYGCVVIPAYVEKYVSDVLNFSKPRFDEVVFCGSLLLAGAALASVEWLHVACGRRLWAVT